MNASRSPIDSVYKSLDSLHRAIWFWGASSPRAIVERIGMFPSSGDIRCAVRNPAAVLDHLRSLYASKALDMDDGDGLSLTFAEWRFKIIQLSEAEAEISLKVESRGDVALMQLKTAELLSRIEEKSSGES